MEAEAEIDLMPNVVEEMPMSSSPTPDPMAGIGYWESPGNSPKLTRKLAANGDHVQEADFAHEQSLRLLHAHNQTCWFDLLFERSVPHLLEAIFLYTGQSIRVAIQ